MRNGNNVMTAIFRAAPFPLNLPMRNGNTGAASGAPPLSQLLNLPMRNGNNALGAKLAVDGVVS